MLIATECVHSYTVLMNEKDTKKNIYSVFLVQLVGDVGVINLFFFFFWYGFPVHKHVYIYTYNNNNNNTATMIFRELFEFLPEKGFVYYIAPKINLPLQPGGRHLETGTRQTKRFN